MDLNHRMAESKSAALPLGEEGIKTFGGRYANNSERMYGAGSENRTRE